MGETTDAVAEDGEESKGWEEHAISSSPPPPSQSGAILRELSH